MNLRKGQSLIELLVALSIFVLTISTVAFLILNVYISDRSGRERSQATFLAEEGLEAARSIRDNNWDDLIENSGYGIATSDNHWIFQKEENDLSDKFNEGKRKIIVEVIDSDRKKVTSQVTWKLTEARPQEVNLVTYLTNWQKEILITQCQGTPIPCSDFAGEPDCNSQDGCFWQPNQCSGSCSCSTMGFFECFFCSQCQLRWIPGQGLVCQGTCLCSNLANESSCNICVPCSWMPEQCDGNVSACETFLTPETCNSQAGCSWIEG